MKEHINAGINNHYSTSDFHRGCGGWGLLQYHVSWRYTGDVGATCRGDMFLNHYSSSRERQVMNGE